MNKAFKTLFTMNNKDLENHFYQHIMKWKLWAILLTELLHWLFFRSIQHFQWTVDGQYVSLPPGWSHCLKAIWQRTGPIHIISSITVACMHKLTLENQNLLILLLHPILSAVMRNHSSWKRKVKESLFQTVVMSLLPWKEFDNRLKEYEWLCKNCESQTL